MVTYVPITDVIVHAEDSTSEGRGKAQFHIELSDVLLSFNKANQEKTLILTNVGWDKLPFKGIVNVNSTFVVTQTLPALLLPGKHYPVKILYNFTAVTQTNGGLYVDVGDSYGYKFVQLSGKII